VVNDLSPLAQAVEGTRLFKAHRQIRLGDVEISGRLRLDALVRYSQDVSDDDTADAGLSDRMSWVVRRTTVDVFAPARLGERLHFKTFCSATGSRWAERRLSVRSKRGAYYEIASLWISVDSNSGRPRPLTEEFCSIYGSSAAGRTVSSRRCNPRPTGVSGSGNSTSGDGGYPAWGNWPLRSTDIDVFGHVNNAAYWELVEAYPMPESPWRGLLEYESGLPPAESAKFQYRLSSGGNQIWWFHDSKVAASFKADLLECGEASTVACQSHPRGDIRHV